MRATKTGCIRLLVSGVAVVGAAMLLTAIMGSGTGVAEAHGLSPAKLSRAGWTCFNVPGLGVHCQTPGSDASSASIPISVFDTSDPGATHAEFLGTEILIRADLYHGQPCPQEDHDEYHGLDLFGDPAIDYYACHRYYTGS
jgi:hypothetical protein